MDDHYWMYVYKVAKCPAKERHDWSACPYAHKGERAARRCPQAFSYAAEPCPEYGKKGTCAKGDTCPLAHSVFESWLHPSRFRTQLCCFGPSCRRRICFFAHNTAQLRAAPATSGPSGGPVMRRTQAVVPGAALGMPGMSAAGTAAFQAAGAPGMPAAALAAAAAAGIGGGGMPATAVLQGQAAGAVPGMPVASSGWVFTGQGWAPTGYNSYYDMSAAAAGSSAAAAAAAAQHSNMIAADVTNLATGFEGLMLQADAQLATSPVQQQQQQQPVLQGVTYLAAMPAGAGVGSSRSGSYGCHSTDAVGDSGACMAAGIISGSNFLVGYSGATAVMVSLPAMALSVAEQQGVQDLQYFQPQQHAQLQQPSRHGPPGW
uniref:C3H1-type domain-containing protein n=1 Tax=Tetradesmus obliquus TaxID=3088 RepID=A0A383WFA9_TETOB|eukprot:jgi/Sobl393_1/14946/SZX68606.1